MMPDDGGGGWRPSDLWMLIEMKLVLLVAKSNRVEPLTAIGLVIDRVVPLRKAVTVRFSPVWLTRTTLATLEVGAPGPLRWKADEPGPVTSNRPAATPATRSWFRSLT